MQHDLQKYLGDIAHALSELREFVQGQTLEDYLSNAQLRRAVERDFIIVGEVFAKIIRRFPETHTRIDHARKIANFRHFLVHEYDDVDDTLVWDIAMHSVPILQNQIDLWIEELDQP
jgi:uncharacterized protein with HEPN domain